MLQKFRDTLNLPSFTWSFLILLLDGMCFLYTRQVAYRLNACNRRQSFQQQRLSRHSEPLLDAPDRVPIAQCRLGRLVGDSECWS